MTIVADSSVWIAFFRQERTRQTAFLNTLDQGNLIVPDLVLMEILQGCATERSYRETRAALEVFPVLPFCNQAVAAEAAPNYLRLRSHGITVRSTIDTLIATRCILDGHELLHADRDFNGFEQHLGLKVPRLPDVS